MERTTYIKEFINNINNNTPLIVHQIDFKSMTLPRFLSLISTWKKKICDIIIIMEK